MKIKKIAQAGSLESSDVLVTVEPSESFEISIKSSVFNTFGHLIEAKVKEVAKEMSLSTGKISLEDKGALNPTIKARVETALIRGAQSE
jgi:citrate lyase subunit gamma (acyl carrier protein)